MREPGGFPSCTGVALDGQDVWFALVHTGQAAGRDTASPSAGSAVGVEL